MKNLKRRLKLFLINIISVFFLSLNAYSNEILIDIKGNNFTDDDVVLSLIKDKPTEISDEYSNYLLKTLNDSFLFENVIINTEENKYIISINEYANINEIYFKNNERFKDEELLTYANELNLKNLNPLSLENFTSEINKLYASFGYNNTEISYSKKIYDKNNTADLYFDINEGEITKIKNILFDGNFLVDNRELKSVINSKTKSLINIFANNNFKESVIQNDVRLLKNYYKNKGFIDIEINYSVEFLLTNKVNIYFEIIEGDIYTFNDVNILDEDDLIDDKIENNIIKFINQSISKEDSFSIEKINNLEKSISDIILESGIELFEIKTLDKKNELEVSILYNIVSIEPRYANQINIYGNSRTMDKVIRRELEIAEGDIIYDSQIKRIQKKLNSLRLFKSVEVVENEINYKSSNIEINVEETQTGTVNAGVSVGTIDGLGVVAGLSERNFYGTGRSVNALINTTDNKTQITLETTDRLSYENDVDISYRSNFKQEDFAVASSYKLDTFLTGIGVSYKLNEKLRHGIDVDYVIKDYKVTDQSTVADSIGRSSGLNVSFILKNNLVYNTLNSYMIPKYGTYLNYANYIETPQSSNNGSFKNILTFKNFKQFNRNVISFQTKLGNVISLNDNDILTDDKFSLGGRWLRGFDSYGAGPRNSRTSYVGGNNLIVTKLDISRELTQNSDFPLYFNLFNDYGLLWENKSKPTNNDNSLRASVGFGIKYYSPIGPIGFSWGFPIMDEDYDINRMFLFSIGNID